MKRGVALINKMGRGKYETVKSKKVCKYLKRGVAFIKGVWY